MSKVADHDLRALHYHYQSHVAKVEARYQAIADALAELLELRAEVASLKETIEIMSDPDMIENLRKGQEDIAAGRVVSHEDVERENSRVIESMNPWQFKLFCMRMEYDGCHGLVPMHPEPSASYVYGFLRPLSWLLTVCRIGRPWLWRWVR